MNLLWSQFSVKVSQRLVLVLTPLTIFSAGCVTRDTRVVERKKPGRVKARKMPTWVKRWACLQYYMYIDYDKFLCFAASSPICFHHTQLTHLRWACDQNSCNHFYKDTSQYKDRVALPVYNEARLYSCCPKQCETAISGACAVWWACWILCARDTGFTNRYVRMLVVHMSQGLTMLHRDDLHLLRLILPALNDGTSYTKNCTILIVMRLWLRRSWKNVLLLKSSKFMHIINPNLCSKYFNPLQLLKPRFSCRIMQEPTFQLCKPATGSCKQCSDFTKLDPMLRERAREKSVCV